ncbi:MAG: Gfo/Idh/MocA family oxidoreductase [Verrucomicrobia bacterium]|nr:Gfo/Idh/MocA family oxidoreductase [Verrucomicrobiota bacterium]
MRTSAPRFCVIGAGRAGLIHARNLAGRIRAASLVALCDPDANTLQKAGSELGVATLLPDYRAAVARTDIDAVVIVTPTFLHAEIACLAAQHGKHIFLEKPMAVSAAECQAILAAVQQAQVKLQIGFMRRFDAGFMEAQEFIRAGHLGRVMIIKSTGRGPGGPGNWMYDLRKSNGIVAEVNSHDLDSIRWLTGLEYENVFAQGHNFKCPEARQDWPDFYDNVVAQFRLSEQAMGVVDGTCPAHYGYDARVEVLGENGVIFIGAAQQPGLVRIDRGGQVAGQAVKSWRTLFKDAYLAEMEHFVACIRDDQPPRVTGVDGLRAVEAVVAVNQSIRTGQPVAIAAGGIA